MDQIAAMRVFVAVVDGQGFSAASRALSMPLPTVCRKIAELERHLDAQLLVRTTRKVTVTDSGQRYYQDVCRILDDIGDAERQVAGEFQTPKGHLTISAPTLFGRLHVLPIVIDFMKIHRDISIRLLLTNTVVDLLEEHINLGVRIGNLATTSMIAVQVGSVRQIICASPGYLAEAPPPSSPDDLARHQCITFSSVGTPTQWALKTRGGKIRQFPVQTRLTVNSTEASVASALQDAGLAFLYSYQAAPHVEAGALEIVLEDYEIDAPPVSVVYPQGQPIPQKLRTFVDYATPRLRASLDRIASQCAAN